ncbi:hypothetical protein [Actinosynnema mirum]|nr:hypothetical protein [Actinosynnema mirum]
MTWSGKRGAVLVTAVALLVGATGVASADQRGDRRSGRGPGSGPRSR